MLGLSCATFAQILDVHKSYDPATVHRMALADASSRAKKHMDGAAALKQVRLQMHVAACFSPCRLVTCLVVDTTASMLPTLHHWE